MELQKFIVCDLETTGIEPRLDKIIEIALVLVEQGEIKDTYSRLVDPGIPLPAKIKRLTGLKDQDLENKPALEDLRLEVETFTSDLPFFGHNVDFDADFLRFHLDLRLLSTFDTLELARIVYPDAPRHSLPSLSQFLDIDHQDHHRALSDATATAFLALNLMNKIKSFNLASIIYIHNFLKQAGSSWAAYISPIIKNKTRMSTGESLKIRYPAPPDTKIKKKFNKASHPSVQIKGSDMEKIFSSGGPLQEHFQHFEHRPQQIKMAVSVANSLNDHRCLLMEAGTGTGKSLAYVIPSLKWALVNKQRAVIATHTINLQEQLWKQDIPILKKVIDEDFSAALVKGRSNYLCLRRWESILSAEKYFTKSEALFFAKLLVWLGKTKTGDKSELNLDQKENEQWLQVCSDHDICQSSYCRWFSRFCFVNRARKAAENSDLIIINHSLLFSDLRSENKILPPFGPLVIDEAHHLEDAATMHLGRQISRTVIKQWVQSIYKIMTRLADIIPPRDGKHWNELLGKSRQERVRVTEKVNRFFENIFAFIQQNTNDKYPRTSFRLKPGEKIQQLIAVEGINLITTLKSIQHCFQELLQLLEVWGTTDDLWFEYAWEIKEMIIVGNTLAEDLEFISSASNQNHVYWIEQYSKSSINLVAVPINVGELLFNNLLKHDRGIVLTSATLTANRNFNYFTERTGINLLPPKQVEMNIVPSPFNYDQQCTLCIDTSIALPGDVREETYFEQLAQSLIQYILAAGGKTLILFTAHYALREVYQRLEAPLDDAGICLLGHNLDGGRTRLIEQFQSNSRSVLLGASSFWEGVDIPGDMLCNVIIIKLPFWPPTIPVIEARLEELSRHGKHSFYQLSLPQAVIRFKQGFGRLIRTARDRGCIIIMDKRLITRRYGKTFLNSLPVKTHFRGDARAIRNKIINYVEDVGKVEMFGNRHI